MDILEKEIGIQNFNLIETGELIPVFVFVAEPYLFHHGLEINEAFQKISILSPQIEALAESAYVEKNKTAWREIQFLLYYWNYRDLMRIERIKHSTVIEYALRNVLLDAHSKNLPAYRLECWNTFTPEKAIEELSDKVIHHPVNQHPFLLRMEREGLASEDLKAFLESYYIGHSLFHLCLAALNFSVPLERRTELANNLYEEMGSGIISKSHPLLFLKNFNAFGRPSMIFPTPESIFLANTMVEATFLSNDYHYGMGGLGAIELSIPYQMRKILEGLKKSGLSKDELEFWEIHIVTDEQHGKIWFSEMLSLIKTPEQAQACLTGALRLLDARERMYDAVLQNM